LDRLRDRSDQRDWERFVELYRRLITMWMVRAGVAESDRDDLLQEVLTTLVQNVAAFEHNGRAGAFRSWLKALVIHRVLNYCRHKNRTVLMSMGPGDESQITELMIEDQMLTANWEQEHDEFVLKQLLELVSDDFARSTWLAFRRTAIEGSAPTLVARELGLSVNAVLIAKSRVLKRLRQEAAGLVD
jgi:RNA polymerase sigma-70 factor (ECF subfamily)